MAGKRAAIGMAGVVAAALVAAPASAQLVPTWQASWDSRIGVSSDQAVQLVAVPAGGSLMVVVSNSRDVSLVRHDADGVLLWEQPSIADSAGERVGLALAADGSAVIAMVDASLPGLVLRRFDSDNGVLHWQRQHLLTGELWLAMSHEPKIALDPFTGHIRVATSDNGDWLILDYAADGTPGAEIVFGSANHLDAAKAMVVDGPGRVIVAGFEMTENSFGRMRVVAFNADGTPRYVDHEAGDVDTLFAWVPMALSLTDEGGVMVLGGPESSCGTFQARLWRLDAAGQRLWTQVWPERRCSPFSPVAMTPLADGSVIVIDASRSAAVRIAADGRFLWQRPGPGFGTSPSPTGVLADGQGRVRVMGHVASGPSGTSRPHVIEWTTDGGLCTVGTGGEPAYGVGMLVLLSDGWLAAGSGPPAAWPGSDAVLQRYPRVGECTVAELFANDFEPPPWLHADVLSDP